jgi:protocatechuate 3,4-dioxygenase beta subunit
VGRGDLPALISRRKVLGGALALGACSRLGEHHVDAVVRACALIPAETGGPFPGDGTNGVNVLALAGVVRADIRGSFGGPTGIAAGAPLTLTLTIIDSLTCAPLANHAVYVWHCDAAGNYSLYSAATVNENYLRGVLETDADGRASFTTVFPGCYPGRWPHVHFEVFESLAAATSGANALVTSQLAFPKPSCDTAYADAAAYPNSAANLAQLSLSTDSVFSDGAELETATVTGAAAELTVNI